MLSKMIAVGVVLFGAALMMSPAQADPQRGYDGRRDGRNDRIECTSDNYRFTRCGADWRRADLVRQISQTRCIEGQTWGVDRHGLWVDRGCGGIFVEAGRGGRDGGGRYGGWNPGPDWDSDIRLTCQSDDYRYRMCQVDTGRGGGVRIERQISNTACIEGRTWGWNRAGIWVSGGCAAVFRVDRRWR